MINLEDFKKCDIRVATIISVDEIEGADKLYKLVVNCGDEEPRQIVSGIKEFFEPDDLVGKQILIIANLEPRKLRGVESNGMILAAKDGDTFALIVPEREIKPGSSIT